MAILNNSPVLSLNEIIVKLFNNKFLSDCVFSFENENRVMHAHSLILRSRSVVFEKQFESSSEDDTKLIPIMKYSFESFSQFMRFIYTDECNITSENVTAMLELAVKYRIPKLENIVNRFITENDLVPSEQLRIYQFCVTESYQLLHSWIADLIGSQLSVIINLDSFLEMEPDTLEELLKMDYVGTVANPVHELDIFKVLMRWMASYIRKHNVALVEWRLKFDRLVRAIRFPVMVISELNAAMHEHDSLLTNLDLVSFFTSKNGQIWNFNKRQVYTCDTNEVNISRKVFFQTPEDLNTKPSTSSSNIVKPNIRNSPVSFRTPKALNTKTSTSSSNIVKTPFDFGKSCDLGKQWDALGKPWYSGEPGSATNSSLGEPAVTEKPAFNFTFINPVQLTNQNITTFTPDKDLLITGLWIKASSTILTTITMKCEDEEILKLHLSPHSNESIISFGESIRVHADKQYKITIDDELGLPKLLITKPRDAIHKDVAKCLKEIKLDPKIEEIFFRIPDN